MSKENIEDVLKRLRYYQKHGNKADQEYFGFIIEKIEKSVLKEAVKNPTITVDTYACGEVTFELCVCGDCRHAVYGSTIPYSYRCTNPLSPCRGRITDALFGCTDSEPKVTT